LGDDFSLVHYTWFTYSVFMLLFAVSTVTFDFNWSDGWSKYQKCTWSIWWGCKNVWVDYQKWL